MDNDTVHEAAANGGQNLPAGPLARPDFAREERRGIPEVILAQGKTTAQVIAVAQAFLARTGRALISRLDPATVDDLLHTFPEAVALRYPLARALRLTLPDYPSRSTGGQVGIITAGTSDIPTAEEARFMAEAMGCRVACIFDVGVAGVHRLFEPLDALIAQDVAAVIVAAGMDGALPSLVAGLVPVPVVGLPTPVGYGMGGGGEAALLAMLQSCAPGMATVNIGNGIGAGAFAALIANRVAEARRSSPQPPASVGPNHADAAPAEQASP